ncbi:hypothetical protein KI387_014261, partial [Taxus chinensis]
VTPILEGICHMQGPADELDSEIETDLENDRGSKNLIGSSSNKMDTCMESNSGLECESRIKGSIVEHGDSTFCMASIGKRRGKEVDKSDTAELLTIDAIERKETLVSPKVREPDNVHKARTVMTKMEGFSGTGLECDNKIEKGDSGHMNEESENKVKCISAPQSYCKGKLVLCGEEMQENHKKCSPSEELQRVSHGFSLPCNSVQGFILGSKGASQLADLYAWECCDNLESVMRVDLNLEVPSREGNDRNEIDSLRETDAANELSKKDPTTHLSVPRSITDQRNQPENKSTELSREVFCISPGFDLGTELVSTERKEIIPEIYTESELFSAECEENSMEFGEHTTAEKVYNLTDKFTKLAENVVEQSHSCLEGVTSTVRKKVPLSGTEYLSDVSDEVKPLSFRESLDLQDHNMPAQISVNSNVETTDACANPNLTELRNETECTKLTVMSGPLEIHAFGSPLEKETQKRYTIKENISQEMVTSPILGSSDSFSVNVIIPTKESEPHSGCKQGKSFISLCSTDQIAFPVSKLPVVSTIQENILSVTNPFSDVHSMKHSMEGCVGTDLVPGKLTMNNLQQLAEPSKPVNMLPVDASPDKMDAGNKMDLDEHLERDKMEFELPEMKRASVASAPVFEGCLHEAESVEDDVKVCDICGDAGREDMLAICSKCNDGAEHIYCMRIMLDKVPEGIWLCEGCRSTQNSTLKKEERTQVLMSKPASLSSKKQSSNESSHSRSSDKTEKKRSDPEIKKIIGTSSSQSSTKRRAENLDIGSATKKQAVEVRNVQQGVSSSNSKQVLSRDKSFKSTDFGRTKSSVSGASSKIHLSSGHHNIGKSSAGAGVQSPRFHAGMQSSKSRFTSVNSLTSDSSIIATANSNAASCVVSALTEKAALSSKSADVRPSSGLASRLSNTLKLVTIPKNKKDFGDAGGQAPIIRERSSSGGFNKVMNASLSFKSKGSINVSTVIEPRITPNVQNTSPFQTKETRIGKPRKDGADSVSRKPVLNSGNTVDDSKPAVNDTSVSQTTLRLGLSRNDVCKSKPVVPEEKSILGPSHVAANTIKEECSSTMSSGVSLPNLTTPPIVSKTDLVDIKSEPLASSGALCHSESQMFSEQGNSESTSGLIKLMQVSGSFGFPTDGKGSSSNPNEKLENTDSQSPQNSINDDKHKNFASSRTRNFLPDTGSTRCYKCKELGHAAQFCSNRSSVSTCNNSLRVSALKLSAAKIPREMSWSGSGKWNNPLDTIVPNYTVVCDNDETAEKILLSSNGQELEGRADSNLPSASIAGPFSKESAGVSGKLDGESYMSREFSSLNSDLARDLSSGQLDLVSGTSKDFVANHSDITVTVSGEVPLSTTFGKKNTKGSNNAQIYSSQKLYIDGDGPSISPGDYCKLAATTTITVQPTESTVTAVRRNIPCDLTVISNGNYPVKSMRVHPYQQSSQSETVKMTALPEHNFLWQGGFEVRSKGNPTNHYDVLQAHASTCAASKVLDAAKKFSSSILLEEVPRLSSWPMQFHYSSPNDENVALYFFAKDLESYERSYKKLVERMLKNDFALKTNFDGVELLIFPSNQLPEKSQRWNRLLYLWGVFRERKANCIDSSAYPFERSHGRLLKNVITAENLSSKIAARVLPSLPEAAFSEREDMDIDVEGSQEGSSAERGQAGHGRENSQISQFSPLSSSQDEGKIKGSDIQNASDAVELKLPSTQENDELPAEDKLSLKKHPPKLSSEFGLYSKALYLNKKEKQKPLDTDDGRDAMSLPFRSSVISQISSWRERANSACLGHIPFGPSAVSSSSMERQDNSLDSSKIAQGSSHSQTNTEKEKSKLKDDENDRGRERAKDLEYASFRNKDLGHRKEWKLREKENERERERNGEIVTERERDRRISSRRHDDYSSHESRLHRDSREDRRHHSSHSPTRHGSRSSFPSTRMNNYDHHHYRMRSPDVDQNRHVQSLSGVEACGGSRRRDMVSPRGRSSDFLMDDKGHRKLKKSYSEIYVREICKDQDSSCRNSGGWSSSDLNICSQTQQ